MPPRDFRYSQEFAHILLVKLTTLIVARSHYLLELQAAVEFLGITKQHHAATPDILAHTPFTCLRQPRLKVLHDVANRVRFIWIFCWLTASATSAHAQMESHEKFVCTSGPVKRVVTISKINGKRESGGCRVDYTKDGETKTVWTSKKDYAYCVAKAVSLVTKLAEGNFSCKPETAEQPDEIEPPEQAPAPLSRPE
jgi:hypothetical protein